MREPKSEKRVRRALSLDDWIAQLWNTIKYYDVETYKCIHYIEIGWANMFCPRYILILFIFVLVQFQSVILYSIKFYNCTRYNLFSKV